ncbi:hypothetical protein D9619_009303 [Psilocybe cf. subviscida]|uniref:Uncharacterized protein n=1 Tax=Psilocybe cf. subviscida TaxID=2480587 RepID=A0A8H5BTY2_9AGAR|nr:hypothetical protein D9619_009303 [Psilocybe cf. subviscida]
MDDFTTFDFSFGIDTDAVDESNICSASRSESTLDDITANVPVNADRNPMEYESSILIASQPEPLMNRTTHLRNTSLT